MNRHRHILLTLLVLMIVGTLFFARPAAAQCDIPPGWQPHTVASGETLYRISQRYGTTVATLQAGNCLTSTAIKAGQTLYVPPGVPRPDPTEPPISTGEWHTVPATFQWYERGFMIWRADTSDIWVYIREGRNRLNVHPVGEYGPLTVATDPAPAGFVQPIMGFGKVWSNLGDYRQRLGWANTPEESYRLRFRILSRLMVEFFLPDGTSVLRHSDGFWSDVPASGTDPGGPGASIHTPASGAVLARGQAFTAAGQAVGVFEASFVVELRAMPAGTLLDSQIVTYVAPDFTTPGPWQTILNPGSYSGAAEVRAVYTEPRDGAQVVLATAPVTIG